MKKTNAMRILDGLKIKYETLSYEDDGEHELSRGATENIAAKLGINPAACFKTIVMRNESKQIFVFCQSALHEINLKKARNASASKEITTVKPDELLALTGYIRGGCSPLGMKKKFPTFIDQTALNFEKIYISAGVRGQQIVISPADLVKATDAQTVDLVLE
ncbi:MULTISPECIES: Cys-tRNA(Pro) deacylase [unclassified Treponema]|uniref:Cys-tRNA(Pro) deacylase n=1 Tax=unclassified Treponema TaxID=2638727 RepID=UPI0025EBF077|nr:MULTISPECIES: Cys-tRNA(Pro) deacylase [unclassified Treponema]